jgi:hypothetical protein
MLPCPWRRWAQGRWQHLNVAVCCYVLAARPQSVNVLAGSDGDGRLLQLRQMAAVLVLWLYMLRQRRRRHGEIGPFCGAGF